MLWYVAKLLILLPLLALLIWGSLKLTKHMQTRLSGSADDGRAVRLVETCFLGPGLKVAVIDYRGTEVLLGCSRQGLTRLAEITRPHEAESEPNTPEPAAKAGAAQTRRPA